MDDNVNLASRGHCFGSDRARDGIEAPAAPSMLATPHAQALAALLPVLGCGEEAAGVAFDGLARDPAVDPAAAAGLVLIAQEELVHDDLVHHLRAQLPPVRFDGAVRAAARRFHMRLVRGGPLLHLGRIAALDAAVCTILSRLLRAGAPVAGDPLSAGILRRIHRDETRHVRVSRGLVLDRGGGGAALRGAGEMARTGLADILALLGHAFEALQVDPDRLDRDLRRLPDGLYRA